MATLLTGLSAGLCFTWANAVTTGLSRLDDIGYLAAFQQMNRTILNPTFFLVFLGPVVIGIATVIFYRNATGPILWMLVSAAAIYFFGVALVTVFGNVPINEILDNTDLSQLNETGARELRMKFEINWVRFHLIRTYTSALSFLLLILVCVWRNTA